MINPACTTVPDFRTARNHVKSFGKSVLIFGVGVILVRASAFLLIPLYTHYLSVCEFGLLSTMQATMEIIFVVMHLGLRTAILRFAGDYADRGQSGTLLASAVLVNLVSGALVTGLAVLALGPLFAAMLHIADAAVYVFLACAAALSGSIFFVLISHYRATNQGLKYIAATLACVLLQIVITAAAVIMLSAGVKGVLISNLAANGLVATVLAGLLLPGTGLRISREATQQLVWFGFPLILSMSGSLITEVSTLYILGYVGSMEDVALYSLGNKLAMVIYILVVSPFQIAYEPFVFGHIHEAEGQRAVGRILTYLLLVFMAAALGLVVAGKFMLPLIAPSNYADAFRIMMLLLPAVAFTGVFYVGEALLTAAQRTRALAGFVTTFMVICIGLNIAVIPFLGVTGAVLTRNLVSGVRALWVVHEGRRSYPFPLEWKRIMICVAFGGGTLALALALERQPAWMLVLSVGLMGAGALAYLYRSRFLAPAEKEVVWRAMRRIAGDRSDDRN
jgi:O-antigen/teichoic acid export membrane protein